MFGATYFGGTYFSPTYFGGSEIGGVGSYHLTKTAMRFRERAGLIPTLRRPAPRRAPGRMLVHTYPITFPLPLATTELVNNGIPAPDRGLTTVWPNGVTAEEG